MIIGIAGAAGSGKGTAAAVLMERGFVQGKFANALKEMLRALLRYRGVTEGELERYIEGDLKELPTPHLNGKSPRHAMQTLGAWGRNDIDKDFWVETEFDSKSDAKHLIFDDLRHDNEEAAILKHGGVVVQIVGRGGIDSDHLSEQFKPKNPVKVIENTSTIEEFRREVGQTYIDLSWVLAA